MSQGHEQITHRRNYTGTQNNGLTQEKDRRKSPWTFTVYLFMSPTRKCPVLIKMWGESDPHGPLARTKTGDTQTSPALCTRTWAPEHLFGSLTPV